MPYVCAQARDELLEIDSLPLNAGELNYLVTRLVDRYLDSRDPDGFGYEHINAAIGVLECAKLELYRRVVAPYEDRKLMENGDVYECI